MTKPSLRDQRKSEIRKRIQGTARELFIENGFEKTTMRALADAAGVGLGTISLHFKDKKSLLLSSFYDEINEVSLNAVSSVPADSSLKEQFVSMADSLYRYYATNPVFLRSVVKEALFTTGDWKVAFDEQLFGIITAVVTLVDAAKARGEVREDVDPVRIGTIGWSLYLSGLIHGLTAETFDPAAQTAALRSLMDVVFDGVLVRGSHD